jgi:hypothetical protein
VLEKQRQRNDNNQYLTMFDKTTKRKKKYEKSFAVYKS